MCHTQKWMSTGLNACFSKTGYDMPNNACRLRELLKPNKHPQTSHGPTDHQDGTKVLTSAFSLAEIWPILLSSLAVLWLQSRHTQVQKNHGPVLIKSDDSQIFWSSCVLYFQVQNVQEGPTKGRQHLVSSEKIMVSWPPFNKVHFWS